MQPFTLFPHLIIKPSDSIMKTSIVAFFLIIASLHTQAQKSETKTLEPFDRITFDGNARIYLKQGDEPSLKVEARHPEFLADFKSQVVNGTLRMKFRREKDAKRKLKIYLTHTGIERMELSGFINLISTNPIVGQKLQIDADGFVKGDLEVDVQDLDIEVSGFVGLTVFGKARFANFELDGFGNIDALDLEVEEAKKDVSGMARIKVN